MEILIICNDYECYSTVRLAEAGRARGHVVQLCRTWDFTLYAGGAGSRCLFRGKELGGRAGVIPRISASSPVEGLAVIRHLKECGFVVLNSASAVRAAHDKFTTMQLLSSAGIKAPLTALVLRSEDVRAAIGQLGGVPVVIKPRRGSKGRGVILADTEDSAVKMVEALQGGENVILQEYIVESRGRDLRVLVVGGRAVAGMIRQAEEGEFRSNVHLGGRTAAADLEPECRGIAEAAAAVLGLQVAGVDIVSTRQGPKVIEVNACPGLEGIEKATGQNLAGAIIENLEVLCAERRTR